MSRASHEYTRLVVMGTWRWPVVCRAAARRSRNVAEERRSEAIVTGQRASGGTASKLWHKGQEQAEHGVSREAEPSEAPLGRDGGLWGQTGPRKRPVALQATWQRSAHGWRLPKKSYTHETGILLA